MGPQLSSCLGKDHSSAPALSMLPDHEADKCPFEQQKLKFLDIFLYGHVNELLKSESGITLEDSHVC